MDWEGTSYDGVSEREFALYLEEERALDEFEERQYMGWEDPGNDGVDRSPSKWEREVTRMEAVEDGALHDLEGVVYP